MTIDSKYLPRTYEISAGDTEYYFEYESIGGGTVKPLVQYTEADGYVWYDDLGGTVTTTYGGQAPLYSRGKFDFLSGQDVDYGDNQNAKLYVQRETEITQLLDLIPYTPFPAEDFEFGLDKLTLILQEIDGEACSCPWGGTEDNPNQPPDPVVPPGEGYDCSSYEDELATIPELVRLKFYSTALEEMPYPFTPDTTGSDGASFYGDFVASPNIIPDWLGANADTVGIKVIQSSYQPITGSSPDFCGGEILQLGYVDTAKAGAPFAAIPNGPAWGDYSVSAVLGGDADLLGETTDFRIANGTGKRWNYSFGGSVGSYSPESSQGVRVSISGGDVTITCFMSAGTNGYNGGANSMTLPGIGDDLFLVNVHVQSGEPRVVPVLEGNTGNTVGFDLNITAYCNGQFVSLSGVQLFTPANFDGTGTVTVGDISPATHTLYTKPAFFNDGRGKFAYFAHGPVITDVAAIEQAFLRNFTDYTP